MERPFIVISRFQGNAGDGHGQHQYTGLLAKEAFRAAGDPERFPEQLREGLRPWQAMKLYSAGALSPGAARDPRVAEREPDEQEARRAGIDATGQTVSLDTGKYSPWLGSSYINVARKGLSLQRSQTSGRMRHVTGPFVRSYEEVDKTVPTPGGEDLFDGIDVSISGLAEFLPEDDAQQALPLLNDIQETLGSAVSAFDWREPSGVVPTLIRALAMTRFTLATLDPESDAHYFLTIKTQQIREATRTALGLETRATAQQSGPNPSPLFGPVVPGRRFDVAVTLTNRSPLPVTVLGAKLITPPDWRVKVEPGEKTLGENEVWTSLVEVELAENAETWRPHVNRPSIHATYYEGNAWWRPSPPPVARAAIRYRVGPDDNIELVDEVAVQRREDRLPYGYEERELVVLPSLSVGVQPAVSVIPLREGEPTLTLTVEVRNHDREGARASVSLDLPKDWVSEPQRSEIELGREGETRRVGFEVRPTRSGEREATVRAVAEMNGKRYAEDYRIIAHRDLETRYQVRSASTSVRRIDLSVPPGLRVGYVMGVGDEVPAGIAQLGAEVGLLESEDLATGDLETFHAIVIGTRAYAVREDLKNHHRRLLDYVHGGGNLIVLYNTPEFQPQELAPFPGELPPRSEEVSEEDAPIEILQPDHRVFHRPNRIGLEDFDGWVEQRGSKFWSQWDARYQPMLSSHDTGQVPQSGGWLWARYGEGHYTYFAYALHRQLPYGVPGAFRILANLLSLGLPGQ